VPAGGALPADVWQEVLQGVQRIEKMAGRRLGDKESPLLLSVRSGAAVRRHFHSVAHASARARRRRTYK
jgi:hypothetical protein